MPTTQVPESNGRALSERISHVGRDLIQSLHEVLSRAECQSLAAPLVARTFNTNPVFAHRLTKALRRNNPLAAIHVIPGPEPLRRLVAAASKRGVPRSVLRDAESAIAAFEGLIRNECGDRSGLDAILSSWVPDARSQLENTGKQLAYRGMCQVLGIAAERAFTTVFIHPSSDDPERTDRAVLQGYIGLRCIRPGARLNLGVHMYSTEVTQAQNIDGENLVDTADGVLLRRFCSDAPSRLTVHNTGQDACYVMDWGEAAGMNTLQDVVLCEVRRKVIRRVQRSDDPRRYTSVNEAAEVPTRTSVLDVLVHRDVYPNAEPELRTIKNGFLGIALPNDAKRDFDVVDVRESVELLGGETPKFEIGGIPRYSEMLQFVCEKLNWSPMEFRGYRTQVDYPIFGTQLQMRFEVPTQPVK